MAKNAAAIRGKRAESTDAPKETGGKVPGAPEAPDTSNSPAIAALAGGFTRSWVNRPPLKEQFAAQLAAVRMAEHPRHLGHLRPDDLVRYSKLWAAAEALALAVEAQG